MAELPERGHFPGLEIPKLPADDNLRLLAKL